MEKSVCSFEGTAGREEPHGAAGIILDSSMVEHTAVNRGVVGSSPTRGVKEACKRQCLQVFYFFKRLISKGEMPIHFIIGWTRLFIW